MVNQKTGGMLRGANIGVGGWSAKTKPLSAARSFAFLRIVEFGENR